MVTDPVKVKFPTDAEDKVAACSKEILLHTLAKPEEKVWTGRDLPAECWTPMLR
jgi:hypothetical protein